MENQHRKITGYRELTQHEIDLMNEVKAFAEKTKLLIEKIHNQVSEQYSLACNGQTSDTERERILKAEPDRWLESAKHDLQTGFMKLTRAIAQPTTF